MIILFISWWFSVSKCSFFLGGYSLRPWSFNIVHPENQPPCGNDHFRLWRCIFSLKTHHLQVNKDYQATLEELPPVSFMCSLGRIQKREDVWRLGETYLIGFTSPWKKTGKMSYIHSLKLAASLPLKTCWEIWDDPAFLLGGGFGSTPASLMEGEPDDQNS